MTLHREVIQFQKQHNIPDFIMCNNTGMTEKQYKMFIHNKYWPTRLQLIAIIELIQHTPSFPDWYFNDDLYNDMMKSNYFLFKKFSSQ